MPSPPLRILFCSPIGFSRTLGGPKVQLETGDALASLGWESTYLGPADLGLKPIGGLAFERAYAAALADHLRRVSGQYDIVDYLHHHLTAPRQKFSPRTLMVARSMLLIYHFARIDLPRPRTLRGFARQVVKGRGDRAVLAARMADADRTIANADLVNVLCSDDRAELLARGVPAAKVAVLPLGLTDARRAAFASARQAADASRDADRPPTVAFVGTFDYRKGALDLPTIWTHVRARVPNARLKLLGTRGLFRSADEVLAHFPARERASVDVVPAFEPDALPAMLARCDVGLFPSYVEGFGYGVLEMLAAGLPVVAYRSPGPRDLLPDAWLVTPGDVRAMGDRLVEWLQTGGALRETLRERALDQASPFAWSAIGRCIDRTYRERLAELRR